MSAPETRVSREWLELREPADLAARAGELAARLGSCAPRRGGWSIHDLAGGTGAMGRWLAPLLSGPQRWVVHDLDSDLLAVAAAQPPGRAADGEEVTLEAKETDITRLRSDDLSGADLITASAVLDLLTTEELTGLIAACARQRCPVLLTLTVVGHVEMVPPERLDRRVAIAFDSHQRRVSNRGRLLGPDAVAVAVAEFGRIGSDVLIRPSRWRLGASQADLIQAWFNGWVSAACSQETELAAATTVYARRRLAQAAAGELSVTVDHADVLVLPRHRSHRVEKLPAPSGRREGGL